MAPVKKKRVSKKTKKSWRKNIDAKDVDDFFEDIRLEERLGYKFSDRKDEDLFEIDVEGAKPDEKPSGGKIIYNLKQIGPNRQSLRVREKTTPKCFEILEKRSAVPDPIVKRNRVKTREEKRHPIVKKIIQQKREKGILTSKEKASLENQRIKDEKRERETKRGEFNHDVWAEENDVRNLNGHAYWCTNDTIRHTLHNTGKKGRRIPRVHGKSSLILAVEPPHPGTSYNPSVKAQREVVETVIEKENVVKKEEKHIERVTSKMFSHVPAHKIEKDWLEEMSAGLVPTKDDDEEVEEGDYSTVNPPVQNKKKTLQKRRKLREAIALKEQIKQKKLEKRKATDIYKLRKFGEEIKKQEVKTMKNIEKRKKTAEKKPFMTRKLGKIKFEDAEVEFTRNEDLRGTLRESKPVGNLLIDRYKSLQKRNVLEPLLKQTKKKVKRKAYERESTKMGWEPKGY